MAAFHFCWRSLKTYEEQHPTAKKTTEPNAELEHEVEKGPGPVHYEPWMIRELVQQEREIEKSEAMKADWNAFFNFKSPLRLPHEAPSPGIHEHNP